MALSEHCEHCHTAGVVTPATSDGHYLAPGTTRLVATYDGILCGDCGNTLNHALDGDAQAWDARAHELATIL